MDIALDSPEHLPQTKRTRRGSSATVDHKLGDFSWCSIRLATIDTSMTLSVDDKLLESLLLSSSMTFWGQMDLMCSLSVAVEAPPFVTLTFCLLALTLAYALTILALILLSCAFDQVRLVDVQGRSFPAPHVDDLAFDTGDALQGCRGPQQVLSELGLLQILVRDCDLEILLYLFDRQWPVQPAHLLEHFQPSGTFSMTYITQACCRAVETCQLLLVSLIQRVSTLHSWMLPPFLFAYPHP